MICLLAVLSIAFFFVSPVQAQPSIFPSPLPNGQVGTPYNTSLMATGGTPPYTWSTVTGALPPGLSLSSTGIISGTPTTVGTFSFVVQVTDTVPASSQQGFFITITQTPLRFVTTSLPSATEGSAYSAAISVTGGTLPYTWTIASGTLPTGLILGATNGYISGSPEQGTAGSYSLIIGITDSSSPPLSGEQSFSLTIEKGGYESTITIGPGLKAGETNVSAGGKQIATLSGGQSTKLSLNLGATRTISVDTIVQHPTEEGVRFKTETDKITVSEFSTDAEFNYYTEYNIELKTEPSKVATLTGSGWYKEGYTLRANAPDEVELEDEPGTQYRFANWKLPTGETVSNADLSLNVDAPGTCVANYNTYYRLTLTSPYGESEGSAWYKAGSQAEWSLTTQEVRMPGIFGVFGGKLKATNYSGTSNMDGPKTIDINWEPDYTMPLILMPLALLLIIFGSYGLYRLWRSLQPKPAPVFPPYPPYQPMPPPPPYQPIPPPQTTVVMIEGDKPKQIPQTTREQLMEKFGELLEKYEQEIKSSTQSAELPEVKTVKEDKRLQAPKPPPAEVEAEVTPEEESATCSFTSKKPLRVVASNWRQGETRAAALPTPDEEAAESGAGLAIVWTRDVYQEWEILNCWLPKGHKQPHEGSVEIVYSLLNTITEEKIYSPKEKPTPPKPHYTDGMPQIEVAADEIIPPDKLPPETVS
jgi:hypothetical protein